MDYKSLPPRVKEKLKDSCKNGYKTADFQFFLNKHRMGEANEMIVRIQRDKAIDDPDQHKFRDEEFDLD